VETVNQGGWRAGAVVSRPATVGCKAYAPAGNPHGGRHENNRAPNPADFRGLRFGARFGCGKSRAENLSTNQAQRGVADIVVAVSY